MDQTWNVPYDEIQYFVLKDSIFFFLILWGLLETINIILK